jgi:hypothetical protein
MDPLSHVLDVHSNLFHVPQALFFIIIFFQCVSYIILQLQNLFLTTSGRILLFLKFFQIAQALFLILKFILGPSGHIL